MPSVEISEKAFAFLKENAEPLVDTVATTLDRLLEELAAFRGSKSNKSSDAVGGMKFGLKDYPNVTHTKFLSASVNGTPLAKKDWNHLLAATMDAAAESGKTKAEVLSCAPVNIVESTAYQYSYYAVKGLGLSFQGVDAKRACAFIAALASLAGIKISARVQWYAKEGAAFPGEQADIEF